MKKSLILLLTILLGLSIAQARDTYSRDPADLPAAAQTMLKKYFPKKQVNHIKIDKPLIGNADYDVVLSDGTEIDFDHKGDWKEIDCGINSVPKGVLPVAITNYIAKNYKGAKIIKVDKESNKYEIELSNGLDLEFDRAGNFLRVDK